MKKQTERNKMINGFIAEDDKSELAQIKMRTKQQTNINTDIILMYSYVTHSHTNWILLYDLHLTDTHTHTHYVCMCNCVKMKDERYNPNGSETWMTITK